MIDVYLLLLLLLPLLAALFLSAFGWMPLLLIPSP